MRIAILDPVAGISGDMMLGALLDAGLAASALETLPQRVGFPDVQVEIRSVERCGIRAVKVDFAVPVSSHTHSRSIADLVDVVARGQVSDRVKELATRAFQLIGHAEGRVHGVPPDKVHLHEVGAVDAVLDIVGAIEGFEQLGVDAVFNLPVAIGRGWVDAAHGQLPVPAPATMALLEGVEVASGGPIDGEATTPTGAALIRLLSAGPPPPTWRPVTAGWGAGTRDPEHYPNAFRLILADVAKEAAAIDIIATDIDDLSPEYIEPLRQALFEAGALDCQTWSTQGKKGRVSVRLEVLAAPGSAETVKRAVFEHSTTAGVRSWRVLRSTLPRQEMTVELGERIRVRIKVREGPAGHRLKSEYDDVVAAAGILGRPAVDIAREAEERARAILENGHKNRAE
jgi:uncharacterized protein (TIGR00299 family) protein